MQSELLNSAIKLLLTVGSDHPSQGDCRRAVSTAYYALFHFISENSASILSGGKSKRLSRAKTQVYRSLDHRDMILACTCVKGPGREFPAEIVSFAEAFLLLNESRSSADYDPSVNGNFSVPHAFSKISDAETAIRRFQSAHPDDQRAFAILCAVKPPRGERR